MHLLSSSLKQDYYHVCFIDEQAELMKLSNLPGALGLVRGRVGILD